MARFDWRRLALWPSRSPGATGLGPDFPGQSGDRERGRFRPSDYPRLTAVAVVGDDGEPVGYALLPELTELAEEIRKLRLALTLQGVAADLGDLD